MTWKDDLRTEKVYGPNKVISQTFDGETAHLVTLGVDGRLVRVLPDGQTSGQKRSRVIVDALKGLQAAWAADSEGEPLLALRDGEDKLIFDPILYLVGALTVAGLTWELVNALAEVPLDEWLTAWFDNDNAAAPNKLADFLVSDLAADGWAIVRPEVEP